MEHQAVAAERYMLSSEDIAVNEWLVSIQKIDGVYLIFEPLMLIDSND